MNPQYMSTSYPYGGQGEPQNFMPPTGPGRGFQSSGPAAPPPPELTNYYNGSNLHQKSGFESSTAQESSNKQNLSNQYESAIPSLNGPRMRGPPGASSVMRPSMGQMPQTIGEQSRAPRPPVNDIFPGQSQSPKLEMIPPSNMGQTQLTNQMRNMVLTNDSSKLPPIQSGPATGIQQSYPPASLSVGPQSILSSNLSGNLPLGYPSVPIPTSAANLSARLPTPLPHGPPTSAMGHPSGPPAPSMGHHSGHPAPSMGHHSGPPSSSVSYQSGPPPPLPLNQQSSHPSAPSLIHQSGPSHVLLGSHPPGPMPNLMGPSSVIPNSSLIGHPSGPPINVNNQGSISSSITTASHGQIPNLQGPPPLSTIPPASGLYNTSNIGGSHSSVISPPMQGTNYNQGSSVSLLDATFSTVPPSQPFGQFSNSSVPQQSAQPLQGPPPNQYGQQMYGMGSSGHPPPSPGLGPQSFSGGMGSAPMPLQQPRRLDPDQMPSPLLDASFSCTQIQVIEYDKKNRSGYFVTNTQGQVPPLVTTDFYTHDQGISNPRFMRSTMYSVPNTSDIIKQAGVPFVIVINPFARLHAKEEAPPIVNLGEMGPVRCVRCKVYMCPFMQFLDGGRRFQCVFCKASTEVPAEYFAHLDHTGKRVDLFERPELYLGSYEFIATKEYCKNNVLPNPPAFIFMIDVSYNSIKNGMVGLLCQSMKDLLTHLPVEGNVPELSIKVGFVTYNNSVHFYNVKGTLAQPQMMVVSDVEDMFMPLLDGFLVNVSEAEAVIDSLMEQIPLMFEETRETETVLGPVIQAGLEALKAADRAGKLFIFHSSLPIFEAPGRLKNRDDRKLLGTDKEKIILSPQIPFYTKLSQDCVAAACSVDLFLFPNGYIDIATIGQVCSITGGQMFKYSMFQANIDGHRFLEDLKRDISRPIAFDAIMRVRTSTGIRPVDFIGNMYMSNTTDVELASIDADKAVAIEIRHDDKLTEEDGAYIQAAILYTSIGGQRRLRIHNLALNTCNQMAELYRSCDLDTIINWLAKTSVRAVLQHPPKIIRENLINLCAQILACYRKNCASPSSAGQLILPECMKLLPLYTNCILKNDSLIGGQEMTLDDRSWLMNAVIPMDILATVCFFYPRLFPLHELNPDETDFPVAIRCSSERLLDTGVYLLENGLSMFLWLGLNVSQEWLLNVFGVQSAAQIDIDKTSLLELDNALSQRIREIIKKIQEERHRYLKLTIVRQRDKLDPLFRHLLVEDKGANGSSSYVDFLCHMHKEIRNQLS